MNLSEQPTAPAQIPSELIDGLLDELAPVDREAVVLRFFEQQSFAEIASALASTEDATRMRVTRALERMRTSLTRKGVTSTAAALGAALTQEVIAAPAGLAATVHAAAIAAPSISVTAASLTAKWIAGVVTLTVAAGLVMYGFRTLKHPASANLRPDAPAAAKSAALAPASPAVASNPAPTIPTAAQTPPPAKPSGSPPHSSSGISASDLARLARFKPLLAAGMPITGHVSLQDGNVATDVPVSIVMGQDTRIDIGNGSSVTFHPSLADDGTVLYAMEIRSVDPKTGLEIIASTPTVMNFPWANFSIFVGPPDGRDMDSHMVVFDPDPDQFGP